MDKKSLRADDLEVIKKYSDMVYRMAFSLLKNRYDAEDIHQDVFVQYLKKRPKFENSEHERAWFLRVTVNLCRNFWKKAWRQREVGLVEEELDGRTAAGAEETEDEIIGLVKRLPRKYRIVIHLFYYEELSTEEIAKVLGMKPSTVRTQLTRAREKLKVLL
ncbi:MAG: sigma-70 family RNA polymerase sigma factor [Lachnospiraceae bacterium]|nr:sigma-70 family RNA polymerase sigma factor [Lachnospiraceae bacterium]